MNRRDWVLSCCLVCLVGCGDAPTAIEITGAQYADGALSVGVVPKDGQTPVQPAGHAVLSVMQGTETLCSAGPVSFDAANYVGPLLQLEARAACPTDREGLQVRVQFTAVDADELVASSNLVVVRQTQTDTAVAVAEAGPTPANTPSSRPSDWPCGRILDAAAADNDSRFTYEYGQLTECSMPVFFGVVGCPTVERHRLGTGSMNYDRTFRYDDAARVVRVEQRRPSETEPELTFDVVYDGEARVARIVEHRTGRPETALLFSHEGSSVTQQGGPATVTYELDDLRRVLSVERRSSMMGVVRSTWQWQGARVVGMRETNEAGDVVATVTYDYDC